MSKAAQRDVGSDNHAMEAAVLPPLFMEDTGVNLGMLQTLFGPGGGGQGMAQNDDLAFLLGGLTGNNENGPMGNDTAHAIFGLPLDFGGMSPPGMQPMGNPQELMLPPGMKDTIFENNAGGGQQYSPIPHLDYTAYNQGLSPDNIQPNFGFSPPIGPGKFK